jgi:hypothetical protein
MYDKFDLLAMESQLCVAVLGNADITDIELLPIRPQPYGRNKVQALAAQWAGRGLRFIGTIGIVNGQPRTALAVPLDALRMDALSQAFTVHCEAILTDKIEEHQKGDEVDWLCRLWSLPDTRPN